MNGKTHQMGGICSGIMVSTLVLNEQTLNPRTLAVCGVLILGSSIGSLIPDIDKKNTKIRNMLNPFKKKRGKGKNIPLLSGWKENQKRKKDRARERRKPEALRHRGITHSPFFAMTMALILLLGYPLVVASLQPYYFGLSLGFFVGIISHIIIDAMTVDGVPFLAPITYRKYNLMRLKTSRDEHIVTFLFIVATIVTVVYYIQGFVL